MRLRVCDDEDGEEESPGGSNDAARKTESFEEAAKAAWAEVAPHFPGHEFPGHDIEQPVPKPLARGGRGWGASVSAGRGGINCAAGV